LDLSYFFSAGIFVQLALLFYVLGLLARNELLLRGLLLLGTVFYILYYYFISDTPLWDAIWASSVIGIANLTMIGVIIYEKSTIGMSRDMLELYKAFPTLHPGQFRKIMKVAERVEATQTIQICSRNVQLDHLFLVTSGDVLLQRGTKQVEIGPGNFIGELSFLLDRPASADVFAPVGTCFVQWRKRDLAKLMESSPRVSNAIRAPFNHDIALKLTVSWPEYEEHATQPDQL
jgi:hypothetical protein